MIVQETKIRVRYADTDQMKFAYYGKFFEYFEQGRSDLLRGVGLPYSQMEEMGFFLPVVEAHAKYKKAARYDDLLTVITTLRERPIARIRIDYQVFKEGDADPLAEGYTVHSFVSAQSQRPTRAPAQFVETIDKHLNGK